MQDYRGRKRLIKAPGPGQEGAWLGRWSDIWYAIPTLGGVGFLPLCPGTWGSLATVLACFVALPWLNESTFIIVIVSTFCVGFLSLLPLLATQKKPDDDPSYVVIDEAVGQMLAILPVLSTPLYWPLAFVAFRYFDIKKPLLVSWPDLNLHGTPAVSALGIMLDDVLAGIYAGGVTLGIVLLIHFIA